MGKKILLVDDEPDIIDVTSFRLKKAGYDVMTAVNGKEALDKAKASPPDIILLDLLLPVMNGYDVCKSIKGDEKLKDIPVILFTASTVEALSKTVGEVGANGYITKPFEPKELLGKIRELIGE